jgi:hypothetical protein
MNAKFLFTPLLMIPLLTGCASILDSGPKTVQLNSNPEGAKVTIANPEGSQICVTNTPAKVKLSRSAGYFKGADYNVTFEMPGYYPYQAHVESDLDGWYIGNVFFGGLIGMLIIDPATGDMYTLTPHELDCNLIPTSTRPQRLCPQKALLRND